jgi:hypothetical protein
MEDIINVCENSSKAEWQEVVIEWLYVPAVVSPNPTTNRKKAEASFTGYLMDLKLPFTGNVVPSLMLPTLTYLKNNLTVLRN